MYFLYIIKSQHYFSNRVVIDVDSCTVSKRNLKAWLPDFQLFESDRDCILSPTGWLTDTIINAVQIMLKKQFPHINGLQDTCLGSVYQFNSFARGVHSNSFFSWPLANNIHYGFNSSMCCSI